MAEKGARGALVPVKQIMGWGGGKGGTQPSKVFCNCDGEPLDTLIEQSYSFLIGA